MTRSCVVRWIAAGLLATAAAGPLASQAPPTHRRLVICFDGTENNAEQEVEVKAGHKVFKPTNVLKTFRAVVPVTRDGTSQLTFYTEGVGGLIGEPDLFSRELVFLDRINGGAFASGFEGSIKSAYRFLISNYHEGDDIFIFGFSRGAAQAQSLARFIDFVGGLLQKDDEYWLIAFFDDYRESLPPRSRTAAQRFQCIRHPGTEGCTPDKKPANEKAAKEKSAKEKFPAACECENLPRRDGCTKEDPCRAKRGVAIHDARPVRIRFLGVWDTVLATGGRIASDFSKQNVPTVSPKYDFHIGRDGKPPAIVTTVRQALAIDEHRWDFRPQIWRSAADGNQSLKQLWFPGVHSNIGGGYFLDGLANGALQWMIGEAHEEGLDFDCDYLNHFSPCVLGTRCDSDKGFWAVQEFLRGKRGRGVRDLTNGNHVDSAGIAVHESAVHLMVVDAAYRPVNLLTFLAQDEGRIPRLPDSAQRARLLQIVEDFRRQSHGEAARAGRRSLERCPKPQGP